jgi:hypothetical protein
MNISAVTAATPYVPPARAESAEGAGPDHDGDADDVRSVARTPQPTAAAPGRVDVYA